MILNKENARKALWLAGELSWKLHSTQQEMYQGFLNSKNEKFIICCSRQLGKSYFLVILALSEALKTPNSQIKYAAPTQKMARRVVHPIFRQILEDCPEEIRPEWKAQEGLYLFKNGSQIDIAGSDSGNAELLRGTRAHLCIVDEAGFVDDLEYLVKDILLPMTLTTNGKIIMASTPSKLPRHPFEEYYKEAEIDGCTIKKTIYDNPLLTTEKIARFMKESGGAASTTWRREFLAEFIIDEALTVIPEFTKENESKVVRIEIRPDHFDSYVAMDVGMRDFTAILFGYWDFVKSLLVLEDEIFITGLKNVRTDFIAEKIKDKEKELWGSKSPYFRIADRDLLLINDLEGLHQLSFVPTDKHDKDGALNELRLLIQSGHIAINPKCKNLISHLKYATWAPDRKTYARIKGFGHFDGVDALSYLLRNVRRHRNPFPAPIYESNIHYIDRPKTQTGSARTIQNLFRGPKRN